MRRWNPKASLAHPAMETNPDKLPLRIQMHKPRSSEYNVPRIPGTSPPRVRWPRFSPPQPLAFGGGTSRAWFAQPRLLYSNVLPSLPSEEKARVQTHLDVTDSPTTAPGSRTRLRVAGMAVHRPEITTAQPTRSSPTHSPRSSRGPSPRPQTLAQAAEDEAERLPSPMISGEASKHSSSPAQSQYNTPAHRWATPTPEAGGVILNLPSSGHTSVDGLKYSRIESSPLPMLMTSSEDQRRSRGLDSDSISGRTVSPLAWCGPHPRRILWALVLLLFVWSSFIFGCHLQKTVDEQRLTLSSRPEWGPLVSDSGPPVRSHLTPRRDGRSSVRIPPDPAAVLIPPAVQQSPGLAPSRKPGLLIPPCPIPINAIGPVPKNTPDPMASEPQSFEACASLDQCLEARQPRLCPSTL